MATIDDARIVDNYLELKYTYRVKVRHYIRALLDLQMAEEDLRKHGDRVAREEADNPKKDKGKKEDIPEKYAYPVGEICCSFCNKTKDQVRRMIAGPNGIYICDECIEICSDILEEEFEDELMKQEKQEPPVSETAIKKSVRKKNDASHKESKKKAPAKKKTTTKK